MTCSLQHISNQKLIVTAICIVRSISVQSEKSHLFWTSYSKLLHWLCAIAQRMQDSHRGRGVSGASSDNHPSSPAPSRRAWALSRADIPWDKQSKLWSGFTAVEAVKTHLKAMPMLLQTCTRDWTDHGGYGIFFYLWPCCTKKYDSRQWTQADKNSKPIF